MGLFSKKKSKPVAKTFSKNEVETMITNALSTSIRDRVGAVMSGGNDVGDTLHQISADFGYPETIEFNQLWNMYRRSGIAGAVVELITDSCWIDSPDIVGSDQFNSDLKTLSDKLNLFQRLKGGDIRQRVGRYSGLFMRVRDGKKPQEPLEKLNGIGSLVEIIPLYESQLEVIETDKDIMSDSYGKPTMYQLKGGVAGDRNGDLSTFSIHPSRVVIASEGADDGSIYGISSLERPFNALMDIMKIIGSGGEGFYKNAAQSIVLELTDAASAKQNSKLLDGLNENIDDFMKNRSRRSLWTPGLKPTTLQSNLVNPKDFLMNSLYDVAASTKIPVTILIGQLTGRLASNEDGIRLLSQAKSRRENFLNEYVGNAIDWFIFYGILPASNYEIEWSDLMATSGNDKLSIAGKMAEINQKQFQSGGDIPFSGDEVRIAGGFEDDSAIDAEIDETIDDIDE